MSNAATHWAANLEDLQPGSKLVLMLLAECHNGKTGRCDPSIDWLCKKTGYKPRRLFDLLADLEVCGHICRETISLGRGRGKKICFALKIGAPATTMDMQPSAVATEMELQPNAPAKDYNCNSEHLQLQPSAVAYKEEPEENRNTPIPPSKPAAPEPSAALARSVVEEILRIIPKAKAAMAPKDTLPKVVRTILRTTPPEQLLAAVRACYSIERHTREEGQYAPAIYTFLNKGVWKNWTGAAEQASGPAEMTTEDWQRAMRHWVDTGEWLADHVSPPPSDPACTAPANMIRHALKLRPERNAA